MHPPHARPWAPTRAHPLRLLSLHIWNVDERVGLAAWRAHVILAVLVLLLAKGARARHRPEKLLDTFATDDEEAFRVLVFYVKVALDDMRAEASVTRRRRMSTRVARVKVGTRSATIPARINIVFEVRRSATQIEPIHELFQRRA